MGVPPSQIPPQPNIPSSDDQEGEPTPLSGTSDTSTQATSAAPAEPGRESPFGLGKLSSDLSLHKLPAKKIAELKKIIDQAAQDIKDMIQDRLKKLVDKNPKDMEKLLEKELSKEKEKLEKDIESMVALLAGGADAKMSAEAAALLKEVANIPATELKTNAEQISALIQKYCDRLLVTVAGGRPSILVDLKTEASVPSFFQGTQMTLTKTDAGLVVDFSRFSSPVQETSARFAVEQNQEALATLRANLEAKNIALAEFNVAGTKIELPPPVTVTAEPLRAPTEAEEGREERGGKGGGGSPGGGGGGAGEGGGPTGR